MDLFVVFVTGLTVGGLTCLAVQGGLLASVIASQAEIPGSKSNPFLSTAAFLAAKLIAHTVLGALLGGFGQTIGINQNVQIGLQLAAGLYMTVIGLNLLNVHPIFRYAVIQPPKFIFKSVRSQTKKTYLFAPAAVGLMTVAIPCGTTLAMEALAISSASAFKGAAIMFTFVLGTSPFFFGVGWLTEVLGQNFRDRFYKIAALLVMVLGVYSINGSLTALGSPVTLESIAAASPIQLNTSKFGGGAEEVVTADSTGAIQEVTIHIEDDGYNPERLQVKKNIPVKVTVMNKGSYSCAAAFRVPSLKIAHNIKPGSSRVFEFTPDKTGKILYTCSMGMYTGVIQVL